jgi:hypothetical protein
MFFFCPAALASAATLMEAAMRATGDFCALLGPATLPVTDLLLPAMFVLSALQDRRVQLQ